MVEISSIISFECGKNQLDLQVFHATSIKMRRFKLSISDFHLIKVPPPLYHLFT